MFENGKMDWNGLSAEGKQHYMDNYPAEDIIVGMNAVVVQ